MAKTKTDKKDLAVKDKAGALATNDFDYSEFGDQTGFEGCGMDDFSIPYLSVLQATSPQVQDGGTEYIEGARQGMLMNSVTKELFAGKDAGVLFQPCGRQRVYVEWKPRDDSGNGGGVVAVHQPEAEVVATALAESKKFGEYFIHHAEEKDIPAHTNELVETFYIIGHMVDDDLEVLAQMMISFTSTKIKVYKAAMTAMHTLMVQTPAGKKNPPIFCNLLRVATKYVDKGAKKKYYNFDIVPARGDAKSSLIDPKSPLLHLGKKLFDTLAAGDAKINHAGSGEGGGSKAEGNVPF